MKDRVPATLEGLVSAARRIAPSPSRLSRLAEEAAESSTAASTSKLRGALRSRGAIVAAVAVASAFAAFAAMQLGDRPPSASSPHEISTSPPAIPAAPPSAPGPVASHVENQPTEAPTTDVRDLPDPKTLPAIRTASPDTVKPAAADEMSEGALLHRAYATMSSDPERALALTAEHRRRYPRGMLAQEREVMEIEALARLGRAEQARSRAETFYETYPSSAYRRRVDDALAGTSSSKGAR